MNSKLLQKVAEIARPSPLTGKTPEEIAELCKQYSVSFRKRDIPIIIKYLQADEMGRDDIQNTRSGEDALPVLDALEQRVKNPPKVSDQQTKKILENLSYQMTMRMDEYDLEERLGFYIYSPVRLIVSDRESSAPEAGYKNGMENLTACGFKTVQEFAEWLKSKGVRQLKKPKPVKYTPPYYD